MKPDAMGVPSNDETFLREAIRLAAEHSHARAGGPFGALIVRDGEIIGRGWNQVLATNDPTAHAEVVAIREACAAGKSFHLQGAVLYASCEPCPMCLAATCWARIGRVIYAATREDAAGIGFDDAHFYRELSLPPTQRELPMEQALRDEAVKVMHQWARLPGKILY